MDAISRFPVPELADIPEDLRTRMLDVQQKAGFIPNVFLTLAHRPDECRAFFAYHDALMLKDTPALNKAEREMIVVTTSGANDCVYCVVAHGAILRIYTKNPRIADQVATKLGLLAGRVTTAEETLNTLVTTTKIGRAHV